MPTPAEREGLLWRVTPWGGLLALVALTFYPVLGFFFAQDDFGWLLLARYQWTSGANTLTVYHGSFTPIANLLLAAGVRIFGFAPGPFHAANAFFHITATALVAFLARRVTGRWDAAFFAATFFAMTLSHWEAVMWLAGGMPQVVASLFLLAAILVGAHAVESPRFSVWLATFGLFVLALLTKETGVVGPLLFLVYLVFGREGGGAPLPRLPWRARIVMLAPWALVWTAYLAFQAYGFGFARLVAGGMYKASLGGHVIPNALRYGLCLAVPDASSPYMAPHIQALSPLFHAGLASGESVAMCVAPFVIAWLLWRGGRIARFTILWVAVSLVPFVFLTGPLAARYLYLASVGFAIGVGTLFARPAGRWARRVSVIVFMTVVAVNLVGNRLAERTRLTNGAVRRTIVTTVAEAANRTTGCLTVYLVGLPDKYDDVVQGIEVWTRESVTPIRVLDEASLPPRDAEAMAFVWHGGRIEMKSQVAERGVSN
jgi:hypothetical protein